VHPYINRLIADERVADMRADAAAHRLARAIRARRRRTAQRQVAREEAPAEWLPLPQDERWSARPIAGYPVREDDIGLVSAGRGVDDRE
jgi:hypothetical protein